MSSLKRPLIVLVACSLFIVLAPAAQASDTMLDLVRELGAQPAPAAAKRTAKAAVKVSAAKRPRCTPAGATSRIRKAAHAAKARKAIHRAHGRRMARRQMMRLPRHLSAAALGSGRVDVIDMSGPISLDERPAIAAKSGL
jgi:hypothetical protein